MNQRSERDHRSARPDLISALLLLSIVAFSVFGFATGKWEDFHLPEILLAIVVASVVRAHYRHTRMRCLNCNAVVKATQQQNDGDLLFTCEICKLNWVRENRTGSAASGGAEDMHFD